MIAVGFKMLIQLAVALCDSEKLRSVYIAIAVPHLLADPPEVALKPPTQDHRQNVESRPKRGDAQLCRQRNTVGGQVPLLVRYSPLPKMCTLFVVGLPFE